MSHFGQVEDITMQHKFVNEQKVFKGYAFVLMASKEAQNRGLQARELYIGDRRVEIKPALPKGKKSEDYKKLEGTSTADRQSSMSSSLKSSNYCFRLSKTMAAPNVSFMGGKSGSVEVVKSSKRVCKNFVFYCIEEADLKQLEALEEVLNNERLELEQQLIVLRKEVEEMKPAVLAHTEFYNLDYFI